MIEIGSITPPSVQLLPAKRYTGAPIGTSYDIRVYTGKWKHDGYLVTVGWVRKFG